MDQNTPVETFRDGRLKATVWQNQNSKDETYHTVTLAKTYEDRNGNLKDTNSFSAEELLKVNELASEAYGFVRGIRRDMARERNAERNNQPDWEDRPERFRGRGSDQDRQHDHSGPGMER